MTSSPDVSSLVTRRTVLKTLGAGAALLGLGLNGASRAFAIDFVPDTAPAAPAKKTVPVTPFVLPPLGYAYDALVPYIDARTMEIHHTKHHQAFITNLNLVIASEPELFAFGPVALLANLDVIPEPARTALRNNLGGHMNHVFFWDIIRPRATATAAVADASVTAPDAVPAANVPSGALAEAITETFGSFETFQARFAEAAMKRFGSGWAWLLVEHGKLVIRSTANQDSPLMEGAQPVLALDVWEHAYYLNYQNRRADYITAFWNVANWDVASERFAAALLQG